VFAHLSLFINKGGGKLSKREGATSLLEYKRLGYLPEAVVNFIAFLGWNPKTEQEFFSMEQLIAAFDLSQVNTANPIFDTEKLDWFNGHYLRLLPLPQLVELCKPYLPAADDAYIAKIVQLEQERLKRYSDITDLTDYFFTETLQYDPALLVWKKSTAEQTKVVLQALLEKLTTIHDWSETTIEAELMPWIKQSGYGNGDVLWPMRAAITGKKASPSPFAVASVLGQSKVLARIQAAISLL